MKKEVAKFGRVAVLLGGLSSEREISLMSGQAVLEALLRQGVDAFALDVDEHIAKRLLSEKIDRVFNVLHGPGGEDGLIQGLLESLRLPYTGSGIAASALTIDKIQTKLIWKALGFPTLDFIKLDSGISPERVVERLGFPLAIKPVYQGSTLGISKVHDIPQFEQACLHASRFDSHIIAEPWIEGKELTVGILGNRPLPVIHIESPSGFYDYEAKYFSDETLYHCPSGLEPLFEKKVQELCYKAYEVLGCRHWGRVDLMMDHNEQLWLLEVNTIPGMTTHSLVPKAAMQIGIDFDELVMQILTMTLTDSYG